MEFKILLVFFAITLDRVQCQDRRCVSICNEEDEIFNSGRKFYTGSSGRLGDKGDRGIPGKAGPFGLQGPPGTKGNQGVRGPPGIDGAAGIQGPPGEKGIQGVRGPPGIDGAAGIQGPPGKKGNQGVKGESGSTDGIAAFQQEIRNLMTDFNHSLSLLESTNAKIDFSFLPNQPVNCLQSDEDGFQLLRSGERVYCRQHWRWFGTKGPRIEVLLNKLSVQVIQRRFNGKVIFHNKTWNEYKNGFGSLSTEFWIGLDKIHHLTRNRECRLRVELGAFDGSEAYAEYREFSIGSETNLFRLHISGYSGTAGDAIMYSGNNNNNMAFTTIDRKNDRHSSINCAVGYVGGLGAWWWDACGHAHLNGRWKENLNIWESFNWFEWKNTWITLKSSTMMIRCD